MPHTPDRIRIRGARQNNLKNLDLDLPTGELIVITGVSGSGKSSLAFDTLYAEGQRRYVETFSAYARQFLDRMDRPQVDRIEGVPPAIAVDQTNPVRTSRSTVGTMTELNDHLKVLFARAATLYCRGCAQPVRRDSAQSIYETLLRAFVNEADARVAISFAVPVPENFTQDEVRARLAAQGYTRVFAQTGGAQLVVIQDRLRWADAPRARVLEALESALRFGGGKIAVHTGEAARGDWEQSVPEPNFRFSTDLHCADCDIHYAQAHPSLFSFNSPLGACETCRGFGRVIGVDLGLVIPDDKKTLREGAVRPWQSKSFADCQREMEKYAAKFSIPLDTPWRLLSDAQRAWVIDGEPAWRGKWQTQWYGITHFFRWLESKAYKMHIRVLLSKYRAYSTCPACEGARLKPDALLFRLGNTRLDVGAPRHRPQGVRWSEAQLAALPGLNLHDLMLLPIERVRSFIASLSFTGLMDQAMRVLLGEINTRLRFLCEVGLGYLTLDRQSRTLSGGEVQRINLTTALGTSLVNTLFVLDEPSIGLHPRDMHRVIAIMQRLRSAGNTLVVVEHDPQVMLAADRLIDMGPGPGERGGEIIYNGAPAHIPGAQTLTADYLSGRKQVEVPLLDTFGKATRNVPPNTPKLLVEGARAHNLKNIDVEIPLGKLTVITGVSGSGKSTLVHDVLYRALAKAKGQAVEAPGEHTRLAGDDWIADVAMVDQSPIGKTTRSNPASYVGAWDAIRSLFARAPLAQERNYSAGMFSFNAGDGRCPTCGGNGFEHVEMQFLSDVYLRCPDCNGKRFRPEVLEVTLTRGAQALSVADVLDLTVRQALDFFAGAREVTRALQPLADVGLEYIKLGQAVPTLSGGESQRLKIAGFLAQAAKKGTLDGAKLARFGSLLLFDEPTTGLHFDDVARLMRALRKLLAAGHSLVVIEHNLDVMRSADWIIDLGPEAGEAGGQIVVAGTPREVMDCAASHTGAALREYQSQFDSPSASALKVAQPPAAYPAQAAAEPSNNISIRHAREHNLKAIDVDIPRGRFTVITGVSGSGKSTLAFDILFNEGQRRYLESLNAYARSIVQPAGKPDVDAIYGIAPTVAIEQRTSRGGHKSTVATLTEIYHYLRLLYVKLGTQHCPDCHTPVQPQSFEAIAASVLSEFRGRHIGILAPLVVNRKGLYTDLARWAKSKGYTHLRVDGRFEPTARWPRLDRFREHTIELPVGDLVVYADDEATLRAQLTTALEHGHGNLNILWPLDRLKDALASGHSDIALESRSYSTQRACASCRRSFPEPDPRLFSYNSKHGWCKACFGTGLVLAGFDAEQSGEESAWQDEASHPDTCAHCHGARLNPTALAVRWQGRGIAELAAQTVSESLAGFKQLQLAGREQSIAQDLLQEVRARLAFLEEVGLGYLALDRAAPTLSGGEAQRIRLAAQLGSNLQGVCYVLDEPTIGLHARDNHILLNALAQLEAKGNTLVVVEHDEDTLRRADHLIDIGPGAGTRGGRIVAQGDINSLMQAPESITGRYLKTPLPIPAAPRRPVQDNEAQLIIQGARLHNLQNLDAHIPLARLTVVTGVSGSGKSSLARDCLLANAAQQLTARNNRKPAPPWQGCAQITGLEAIDRVLEVDQTPIGKTPRSCPATYVGFWDKVRALFADTQEARMRGFATARFSFNTGPGRCPACEGAGVRTIEMNFLPDVKLRCDICNGARFNPETLSVTLRGKSIGQVLAMEVDEAAEFFAHSPSITHPLKLLQAVGLGYLTLGQPSPTLSGGEAQRLKLVTELAKARIDTGLTRTGRASRAPHTLYVLDEPTVGLAMADVEKLIQVLHRLVDAGNTVVVIEHHLDLAAQADWLLDLGPEGGAGGGELIAQATPQQVAKLNTHTGKALRELMGQRAQNAQASTAVSSSA